MSRRSGRLEHRATVVAPPASPRPAASGTKRRRAARDGDGDDDDGDDDDPDEAKNVEAKNDDNDDDEEKEEEEEEDDTKKTSAQQAAAGRRPPSKRRGGRADRAQAAREEEAEDAEEEEKEAKDTAPRRRSQRRHGGGRGTLNATAAATDDDAEEEEEEEEEEKSPRRRQPRQRRSSSAAASSGAPSPSPSPSAKPRPKRARSSSVSSIQPERVKNEDEEEDEEEEAEAGSPRRARAAASPAGPRGAGARARAKADATAAERAAARKALPVPALPADELDCSGDVACCVLCATRAVVRAAAHADAAALRQALGEASALHSAHAAVAPDHPDAVALVAAVRSGNAEVVRTLVEDMRTPAAVRAPAPTCRLKDDTGTGYASRGTFSHGVRQLNTSRGGREGNAALLAWAAADPAGLQAAPPASAGGRRARGNRFGHGGDDDTAVDYDTKRSSFVSLSSWRTALARLPGVAPELLDYLMMEAPGFRAYVGFRGVLDAAEAGNHTSAAHFVRLLADQGAASAGFGFNKVHVEALGAKPFTPFRRPSATKKAINNASITPVHLAAINPTAGAARLAELAAAVDGPIYGVLDDAGRSPVHFAAACAATGPLQYLLGKGGDPFRPDLRGITPLMMAARAGAAHNVRLLAKAKAREPSEEDDPDGDDAAAEAGAGAGAGATGRGAKKASAASAATAATAASPVDGTKLKTGYTALHFAAHYGHASTVAALLDAGAAVDLPDKVAKMTALHHAARAGSVATVRILHEQGHADLHARDKLGRTAVHHAAKNGHVAVVLYALQRGADADAADTSDNVPLHYAAAYGWATVAQLLIGYGGADPNRENNWKTTPLLVASAKGHLRLVDLLLSLDGGRVDVNSRDKEGGTLLHHAATEVHNAATRTSALRLAELLARHRPNPSLADVNGNTPLHVIAGAAPQRQPAAPDGALPAPLGLARILLGLGAHVDLANKAGVTPLGLAVGRRNVAVVEALVAAGADVAGATDAEGSNLLHALLGNLGERLKLIDRAVAMPERSKEDEAKDALAVEEQTRLWALVQTLPADVRRRMAHAVRHDGTVPLTHGLNTLRAPWVDRAAQLDEKQPLPSSGTLPDAVVATVVELLGSCAPDVDAPVVAVVNPATGKPYLGSDDHESLGQRALHVAVLWPEIVRLLVQAGAQVDATDRRGRTALREAVELTPRKLDRQMNRHRNLSWYDSRQWEKKNDSPEAKAERVQFEAAEVAAQTLVVRTLLEAGASAAVPDIAGGLTPLLCAIDQPPARRYLVELLLAHGRGPQARAAVNAADGTGRYPLLHAVQRGDEALARLLLAAGAEANRDDGAAAAPGPPATAAAAAAAAAAGPGRPLALLAVERCPQLLGALLEAGADASAADRATGRSVLLAAAAASPDAVPIAVFRAAVARAGIPAVLNRAERPSGTTALLAAAALGALDRVVALLDAGAGVDIADARGWTPLAHAIKAKSRAVVERLIAGGASVHARVGKRAQPLLHLAVLHSAPAAVVDALLDRGADVMATCAAGDSALHCAVERDRTDTDAAFKLERRLLRAGATIDARNALGRTPLHVAFVARRVVPLMAATLRERTEQLVGDLDRAAEPPAPDEEDAGDDYARDAALPATDPIEITSFLCNVPGCPYDVADRFGRTPLQYAAAVGAFTCITLLLQRGRVNVAAADADGHTAVQIAALAGHGHVAVMLAGAEGASLMGAVAAPSLALRDKVTAARAAIAAARRAAAAGTEVVVAEAPADGPPGPSPTPAARAAAVAAREAVEAAERALAQVPAPTSTFRFAIERGFVGLAFAIMQRAPLDLALAVDDCLSTGKFQLAQAVLEGATAPRRLAARLPDGRGLFHIVAGFVRPANAAVFDEEYAADFGRLLVESGFDAAARDATPRAATALHYAAGRGHASMVAFLLTHPGARADANAVDATGATPIADATARLGPGPQRTAIVQMLLAHGARLTASPGSTVAPPLLYALDDDELTATLLAAGADPNERGPAGETALVTALAARGADGAFAVVGHLLRAGADPRRAGLPLGHAAPASSPTAAAPASSPTAAAPAPPMLAGPLAYALWSEPVDAPVDRSVVAALLASGADPNGLLLYTLVERKLSFFRALVRAGATANERDAPVSAWLLASASKLRGKAPAPTLAGASVLDVLLAAPAVDLPLVELALGAGADPSSADPRSGQTPLLVALVGGAPVSLLETLLRHGADAARAGADGTTPLMAGAQLGRIDVCRLLLAAPRPPNVHAVDARGRTALHHAIGYGDFATAENVPLLQLLLAAGAGADVDAPDADGQSPRQLAARQASGRMLAALLGGMAATAHAGAPAAEEMEEDGVAPVDLEGDAQAARAVLEAEAVRRAGTVEAKVDTVSNLQDVGSVHVQPGMPPYDVLLIKVDVAHGVFGQNLFYRLQIIHNRAQDLYVLWTRWGQPGDRGQFQRTPFNKPEGAVKEFEEIFKSKTGNVWGPGYDERFERKPNKFVLVRVQPDLPDLVLPPRVDARHAPALQLQGPLRDLVRLIGNVATIHAGAEDNAAALPLGRLTRQALETAMGTLHRLRDAVAELEQTRRSVKGTDDLGRLKVLTQTVIDLSNDFHTLLPAAASSEGLRPFNNLEGINVRLMQLSRLLDVAVGASVLLGASHRAAEIHPLDYVYRAIGTRLSPVARGSAEYAELVEYQRCSGADSDAAGAQVLDVFRVDRAGERARLAPHRGDERQLLWHGSSLSNFVGILKQGLRIAPTFAPVSGHMFGKGIYFADRFAKSYGYTYLRRQVPGAPAELVHYACLLLCEVATGSPAELTQAASLAEPPAGCQSVKGLGLRGPAPENARWTVADGVRIPAGPTVAYPVPEGLVPPEQRRTLQHNEYIVYDDARVRMRYLVLVRAPNVCGLCHAVDRGAALLPLRDHVFSEWPASVLSGNAHERRLLERSLPVAAAGKPAAQVLFGQAVAHLDAGGASDVFVGRVVAPRTWHEACRACATRVLAEAAYRLRLAALAEDGPDAAARRPDCPYGRECRTQAHNEAHARSLNHICENTHTPPKPRATSAPDWDLFLSPRDDKDPVAPAPRDAQEAMDVDGSGGNDGEDGSGAEDGEDGSGAEDDGSGAEGGEDGTDDGGDGSGAEDGEEAQRNPQQRHTPNAFQTFMMDELRRLKAANPSLAHKDAIVQAATAWQQRNQRR